MTGYFELMDLSTANVIGHFESEEEALAIVRNVVTDEGSQAVDELALSFKPSGRQPLLVAIGADLAERAQARTVSRA